MLYMASIAERFIPRSPAPAEGNPVPDRVDPFVSGLDRDPAAAHVPESIFDHDDGLIKSRLDHMKHHLKRNAEGEI